MKKGITIDLFVQADSPISMSRKTSVYEVIAKQDCTKPKLCTTSFVCA